MHRGLDFMVLALHEVNNYLLIYLPVRSGEAKKHNFNGPDLNVYVAILRAGPKKIRFGSYNQPTHGVNNEKYRGKNKKAQIDPNNFGPVKLAQMKITSRTRMLSS